MEHSFLDKYSERKSLIHRLDPRVKTTSFFAYVFFVILTPQESSSQFWAYLILMSSVAIMSRIPLSYIFKRSLVIIPFVMLTAIFIPFFKTEESVFLYNLGSFQLKISYDGLWIFWNILVKSWLSTLAMILLSSTTKFSDLLKGLQKLHVPKVFLMILTFMYRYIFVLIDEAMQMNRAYEIRAVCKKSLLQIKDQSHIIGLLFIRAFERGERVYISMCSRGFEGKIITLNTLQIRWLDVSFATSFLCILFLIKFSAK